MVTLAKLCQAFLDIYLNTILSKYYFFYVCHGTYMIVVFTGKYKDRQCEKFYN